MRNFSAIVAATLLCAASPAWADGYLAQRFEPAPAGAGWMTQDSLKLAGGLGGALAFTTGYRHTPDEAHATPITDFAIANIGMAATYDRYRLSFDLASPLYVRGPAADSPRLDIASHPDTTLDVRIALAARLWGDVDGPFRVGASAQLFVPSADQSDYMSDGTYRAQFRALVAGDVGGLVYAAHVGYHARPLFRAEVLAGAAGGWRFALRESRAAVVIGAEGNAAWTGGAVAGSYHTLEGLLGLRYERPGLFGHLLRVKLGGGLGMELGSPVGGRVVVAVEFVGLADEVTEAER